MAAQAATHDRPQQNVVHKKIRYCGNPFRALDPKRSRKLVVSGRLRGHDEACGLNGTKP